MGYAFLVSDPIVRHIDGTKYVTWTVTESVDGTGDIAATDEWTIPGLPTPCTVTLLEAHLETPGDAATIRTALGLAASFVLSDLAGGGLYQVATAAAYLREQADIRVPAMPAGAALVGRSTVDAPTGATGVIKSRITVRVGH
jgi:hypothetical protein